jgi:hypothetical protein
LVVTQVTCFQISDALTAEDGRLQRTSCFALMMTALNY